MPALREIKDMERQRPSLLRGCAQITHWRLKDKQEENTTAAG
jgi:hypothetical protein